jgi:hypothetical protein
MESKDTSSKYLLHIDYNCSVSSFGPENEWVIYEGERIPSLGEGGFGKTNCLHYVSIQSCEFEENCNPHRGKINVIEPYSKERAQELGLEKKVE